MQDLTLVEVHVKLDEIYHYYSQMPSLSVIPAKAGIQEE
jgi:hypothetical protein